LKQHAADKTIVKLQTSDYRLSSSSSGVENSGYNADGMPEEAMVVMMAMVRRANKVLDADRVLCN
jgi:hypothetical protein